MARAILELIGDADSAVRAVKQTTQATKEMGIAAEKTARAQVAAATKRDARLRAEIATYRQLAAAAEKGSREQIAAANLAAQAEARLARSLGVTSAEARIHARNVAGAERSLSRFSRGALAGSGIAKSLGRSLAFASGGFIATATAFGLLRNSLEAATEAAAVERQLAAQFRAVGQSVNQYRLQIQSAALETSRLSGFTEVDLTRAFTTAFRATRSVSDAMTIMRTSAAAARGSGRDLSAVTLALTRAWGGAAASLRRLGILVPKTAKGMDAIAFVQRRFAGQISAGTTAQQRFSAALHNTEVTIGMTLLPTLNRLLNRATNWLSSTEHQREIQMQFNQTLRITGKVLGLVGDAFKIAAAGAHVYNKALASLNKPLIGSGGNDLFSQIFKVLFQPGYGFSQALKFLNRAGGGTGGGAIGRNAPEQMGRSPFGPAPMPRTGPAPLPPGPLGFRARFATAELALAQAQLTQTQRDDRLMLQAEAKLLRERIKALGTSRKTLAERTQLTQQLVGIEGQIASIDDAAARSRKTAADKALAARKAALATEAKRLADEKTAADKELRTLKQRESNLKQQIKSITQSFQSAVMTARSGIGDLFGGPVLNFSDEQRKAALGIPNQASDPRAIARDITAQNRQFVQRQRLINRIVARAPKTFRGLVRSDIENLDLMQLQGIGAMNSRQFAALIARERLSGQTARVQMRAQLVTLHADRLQLAKVQRQEVKVEVEIKGIAKDQATVKVKQSAAQKRGDNAGKGG